MSHGPNIVRPQLYSCLSWLGGFRLHVQPSVVYEVSREEALIVGCQRAAELLDVLKRALDEERRLIKEEAREARAREKRHAKVRGKVKQ
jgi:hypothetical protein